MKTKPLSIKLILRGRFMNDQWQLTTDDFKSPHLSYAQERQ